jgi:outer membrane biosynthesis protein TonB
MTMAEAIRRDIAASRSTMQGTMVVSAVCHVLIMAWLVLAPPATTHRDPVTDIEVLSQADLRPPEPPPVVEEEEPQGPGAEQEVASAPAPAPAPAPRVEAPAPAAAPPQQVASAPPPPPKGAAGRAAAAQVSQAVQNGNLLGDLDQMIGGIENSAPAPKGAGRGAEGGSSKAAMAALSSAAGRESGSGAIGQAAAGVGTGNGIGSGTLSRSSVGIEAIALGGAGTGGAGGGGGDAAGAGSPDGSDTRSTAALMAVVHRYAGGIKYCYDRCLETNPEVRGRMVLVITVAPNGTVAKVQVATETVKNEVLSGCVLDQVKAWKFPASTGPAVSFRCPLVFTPPTQ